MSQCTATATFDNGWGGTFMLECHQSKPHPDLNHYDATVSIYWAYTGQEPPLAHRPDFASAPLVTP